MKRSLRVLSLLLLFVLMLSSCGEASTKDTPMPPTREQQAMLDAIESDFSDSSSSNSLGKNIIQRLATANDTSTVYEKNGVKVESHSDSSKVNVTYTDYKIDNSTLSGGFSFTSNVTEIDTYYHLEGGFVLSSEDVEKLSYTFTFDTSSEPVFEVKKDGAELDTNEYENFLTIATDALRGAVNAVIADYTISGDGIYLSLKGSIDLIYNEDEITEFVFDINNLSFRCSGVRGTSGRSYDINIAVNGDPTLVVVRDDVEKPTIAYKGKLNFNAFTIKAGSDTLVLEGLKLDLAKLSNDDYIDSLLGTITMRINDQVIDIKPINLSL